MAGQRWDRDRVYKRDVVENDRYYMRGGRGRDHSEERFDRPRGYEHDYHHDRRFYDDDVRFDPRRDRIPPPAHEYDRRVVIEKDHDHEYYRDPLPHRSAFPHRQSSLDTDDRRPFRHFYDREEYPPPARREDLYREDYRAPAYMPIPLPKSRALPPSRPYPDHDFHDDGFVVDRDRGRGRHYHDDDLPPYPDRMREREVYRSRERRDHSRDSHKTRSRTHRSNSHSSACSSHSSSSGGRSKKHRNEYPKKGKTKIPARLLSKRALMDVGYPYTEEDDIVVIKKALSRDHIDRLIKLSDEYIKADHELAAARSSAGNYAEERKEEVFVSAPAPAPAPVLMTTAPEMHASPHPHPAATTVIEALPPAAPRTAVEVVDRTKTIIREPSPARTATTTSWDSHHYQHRNDELLAGPVVERARSRSRTGREIRAEIRALERELAHRPRGNLGEREVIRTERLPDGQLVVYEEKVERQAAGPKPPRIEKDKKGPPPRLLRAMLATLT